MIPPHTLYTGRIVPPTEALQLRAGPCSAVFEDGVLRTIMCGEEEVLRRVYVAVRDRNFATVPLQISQVDLQSNEHSFKLTFDAVHQRGEIDFAWHAEIVGSESGEISFAFDGLARSTFWRSRIGFCVLHPLRGCIDRPYQVHHVNGLNQFGLFPANIAPHALAIEMAGITHQLPSGVRAEVRFSGEIFEMEDQRNWSDPSFKSYCTPLRLPYPVEISAGTRVQQSVTLRLIGANKLARRIERAARPAVRWGETPGAPLPCIGLGLPDPAELLTSAECARLTRLRLAHLRLDLRLSNPSWPATLDEASSSARSLGNALEVALHLSPHADAELTALRQWLEREQQTPVRRWIIYSQTERVTPAGLVALARATLTGFAPSAEFAGGTNVYYVDINRERPPLELLDAVTISINPQVHTTDDRTLIESFEGLRAMLADAPRVTERCPLMVSPLTLRARFRPVIRGPETPMGPDELPAPVDFRQNSLFGAGWLIGALHELLAAGIHSLTCMETVGWRGVMERSAGCPRPDLFPSIPGAVFPLYFVFAWLGEFAGGRYWPTGCTEPLEIASLGMSLEGQSRLLVANLTPRGQSLRVVGLPHRVQIVTLDETNAEFAMRQPETFLAEAGTEEEATGGEHVVELLPYAIARLDSQG